MTHALKAVFLTTLAVVGNLGASTTADANPGLMLLAKNTAATVQDQGTTINNSVLSKHEFHESWGIGKNTYGVRALAAALNAAKDHKGDNSARIPTRFTRFRTGTEDRSYLKDGGLDRIDWIGDNSSQFEYIDGKGGLYLAHYPALSPTYNDRREKSTYSISGGGKPVWHLFAVQEGFDNYKFGTPDAKYADRLNVEFDPDRLVAALPRILEVMQQPKSAATMKQLFEILESCVLLSHGFIHVPKEHVNSVPVSFGLNLDGNENTGRHQVFGTTAAKSAAGNNNIFKQPFLYNHNERGGDHKIGNGQTQGGGRSGGGLPEPKSLAVFDGNITSLLTRRGGPKVGLGL